MLILNDIHAGVSRVAGTTPQSSMDLSNRILREFEKNLLTEHRDLMILGDLFNAFSVDNHTFYGVTKLLFAWLEVHKDGTLYLVNGNHDHSNDTTKKSSLEMLAGILSCWKNNVEYITEPFNGIPGYVVIPHLANQDLFDLAITRNCDKDKTLLAHCNYDNFFAVGKDHSLNLTKDQAHLFKSVIIGHEHNHRLIDNVLALGNQFPTSIADCKDSKTKGAFSLKTQRHNITWESKDSYIDVDWHDLATLEDIYEFVRVSGNAAINEINLAISEISKFRRGSKAYIVANAVINEGAVQSVEEVEAVESLDGLNILEMLYTHLTKQQVAKIEALRAENDN